MSGKLAFGLAATACLGLGGCATAAVGAAASVGVFAAQERTVGQGIDDARASAELKARLMRMDGRAFSRVDVEVAEGRALLTGATPTMEHRIVAERAAWNVPGVEAVANELEVGPNTNVWRSALDEVVSARVRARLVGAEDVRAIDVNVETFRGVVYLMGLVGSPVAQARAEELASRTPGVERVISYIEVRHRPQPEMTESSGGTDQYDVDLADAWAP